MIRQNGCSGYYVCPDQDFIDRSLYFGMVTDWQLIFGTLDTKPQRSPVLSESPSVSGSDLPGQAGSLISCISKSLLGVLPLPSPPRRLRVSAVFALHCFVRFFGCLLLGFAGSSFSSLLGRTMEWRGAKSRRSALASNFQAKPPVSCSSTQ